MVGFELGYSYLAAGSGPAGPALGPVTGEPSRVEKVGKSSLEESIFFKNALEVESFSLKDVFDQLKTHSTI